MTLTVYRKQRDFRKTPEPQGKKPVSGKGPERRYLIQKHAASRLHYDFRLELDGVLKSWAVPKGPSLDPGEKRLAVHVEDHPLEYGEFEGVIPEGEYGGGTVMLWDRGTWQPEADPENGYENGRLSFELFGEKLQGRWSLVRMSGARSEEGKNWLLVKGKDEFARKGDADHFLAENPLSVATGRTLEGIAGEAGVRLTHPDRILFPEQGVTKKSLADYYQRIAAWILPHVAHRPLSLLRCPKGRGATCFFQKHFTESIPAPLRVVQIREKDATRPYLVVDGLDGLIGLVQLGVLEIHLWNAREDRVERPDRMIIDLDPGPGVEPGAVVEATALVHDFLAGIGLAGFIKTSGGKGFHVVAPLIRRSSWDELKAFAKGVAVTLTRRHPDLLVATASKKERAGRIFIDYLRNGRGATSVAPYSTRARAGAPVSAPIRRDELTAGLAPDAYRIDNIEQRLRALKDDPWKDFSDVSQSITKAMKQAVGIE